MFLKKKHGAYFTIAEAIVLIGGLLVIIGSFMPWVSWMDYPVYESKVTYKGYDFGRNIPAATGSYPEVYLVPFVGLFLVLGALMSARRRLSLRPLHVSKWFIIAIGVIVGIVGVFIPIEIAIRFSDHMKLGTIGSGGVTFYNNAQLGWYMTMFGAIIAFIGCNCAFSKKMRQTGLTDYVCVREDDAVPPEETKPSLPAVAVPAVPSAPAGPQLPPQRPALTPPHAPGPTPPPGSRL